MIRSECAFWHWKEVLIFPLCSKSSLLVFHADNYLDFASCKILLHLTLLPLSNVRGIRLTWVICSFCTNIRQNARNWFQPLFFLLYSTAKKQPSLLLWYANKMKKFKTHHPMHESDLFIWITGKLILSWAHTCIHSLYGIFIFTRTLLCSARCLSLTLGNSKIYLVGVYGR